MSPPPMATGEILPDGVLAGWAMAETDGPRPTDGLSWIMRAEEQRRVYAFILGALEDSHLPALHGIRTSIPALELMVQSLSSTTHLNITIVGGGGGGRGGGEKGEEEEEDKGKKQEEGRGRKRKGGGGGRVQRGGGEG